MNTKEFDIELFVPIDILTEGEIDAFGEVIRQMFNGVAIRSIPGPDHEYQAIITNREGSKCARCRNHDVAVGRIWKWPELCWRCSDVMDTIEQHAADQNASTGDYLVDPAAFKTYWLDHYDLHPIRQLALDHGVTKLVRTPDGRRSTTKSPNASDFILEVWGTPDQMPWISVPDQARVTTMALRHPKNDESLMDYMRDIRSDIVSSLVKMEKK